MFDVGVGVRNLNQIDFHPSGGIILSTQRLVSMGGIKCVRIVSR